MVGPKCALPPTTVIDTIMKFKDQVISKNDAGIKSTYLYIYKLFQMLPYI